MPEALLFYFDGLPFTTKFLFSCHLLQIKSILELREGILLIWPSQHMTVYIYTLQSTLQRYKIFISQFWPTWNGAVIKFSKCSWSAQWLQFYLLTGWKLERFFHLRIGDRYQFLSKLLWLRCQIHSGIKLSFTNAPRCGVATLTVSWEEPTATGKTNLGVF